MTNTTGMVMEVPSYICSSTELEDYQAEVMALYLGSIDSVEDILNIDVTKRFFQELILMKKRYLSTCPELGLALAGILAKLQLSDGLRSGHLLSLKRRSSRRKRNKLLFEFRKRAVREAAVWLLGLGDRPAWPEGRARPSSIVEAERMLETLLLLFKETRQAEANLIV